MNLVKPFKNKKVLLRECNRHTAYHAESTCSAVLSRGRGSSPVMSCPESTSVLTVGGLLQPCPGQWGTPVLSWPGGTQDWDTRPPGTGVLPPKTGIPPPETWITPPPHLELGKDLGPVTGLPPKRDTSWV